MTDFIQTDSFKAGSSSAQRRPIASWLRGAALAAVCAVALTACGGNDTGAATIGGTADRSEYEFSDDHAIGNANAKATIIEYASVVCGACANWHTTVYPDFKKKYIDSGLVRFVFREFPTSPENLAQAGFLVANCAGEDKFFENISLQFKRQPQIFAAAGKGGSAVKDEYIAIAKAGGLSEAEFEQCLQDPEEIARYEKVVQMGIDAGVTGTPSFFLNGEKTKMFKLEDFDLALRPILGEEATKSDAREENETMTSSEVKNQDNLSTQSRLDKNYEFMKNSNDIRPEIMCGNLLTAKLASKTQAEFDKWDSRLSQHDCQ